MSVVAKIGIPVKSDESVEFAVEECSFTQDYPGLWEFVARQRYKGEWRATGKLVFFVESGKATMCLIDRCTGQVAFFTSETLDDVLVGSEKALQAGTLDWRLDKKAKFRP